MEHFAADILSGKTDNFCVRARAIVHVCESVGMCTSVHVTHTHSCMRVLCACVHVCVRACVYGCVLYVVIS